jgi:hypothetical protein
MSVTWEYFPTCSHTAPDSCRHCDGTARDERDPNWRVPAPIEPYEPPGKRPLWTYIYPTSTEGDAA